MPHSKRTVENKNSNPSPFDYMIKDISKKSPQFKFGSEKRTNGKLNAFPGPADYHIPCSIRDVPQFVRKKGKFDPEYTFI